MPVDLLAFGSVLLVLFFVGVAVWGFRSLRRVRPSPAPPPLPVPPEEPPYVRLAREAAAYAAQPYVTTALHAEGARLHRVIADAFSRRCYVETRRRHGPEIVASLCRFEGLDFRLVEDASATFPVAGPEWPPLYAQLRAVQADGSVLSFTDGRGWRYVVSYPFPKGLCA